jgi:hypothetical protein
MNAWLALLIPSALVGLVCSCFIKTRISVFLAGAIPWLGILAFLLYQEYFVPYQSGGASMWPIALLFGGTAAAATGIAVWWIGTKIFRRQI